MDTQTKQPAASGRFELKEIVIEKRKCPDDLPDGRFPAAVRKLQELQYYAQANPDQPWTPFPPKPENPAAQPILDLWSLGLARICFVGDIKTRAIEFYAAPIHPGQPEDGDDQ